MRILFGVLDPHERACDPRSVSLMSGGGADDGVRKLGR